MPDFRIDSFPLGMTDQWQGGKPGYARRLRNVFLDDEGRPYTRPSIVSINTGYGNLGSQLYGLGPKRGEFYDDLVAVLANKVYRNFKLASGTEAPFQQSPLISYSEARKVGVAHDQARQSVSLEKNHVVICSKQHIPVKYVRLRRFSSSDTNERLMSCGVPNMEIACTSFGLTSLSNPFPGASQYSFNVHMCIRREYRVVSDSGEFILFVDRSPPSYLPEAGSGGGATDALNLGTSVSFMGGGASATLYFDCPRIIDTENVWQPGDIAGGYVKCYAELYMTQNAQTIPKLIHSFEITKGSSPTAGYIVIQPGPYISEVTGGALPDCGIAVNWPAAEPLYTIGGIAPTSSPPPCKFFAVVNECGWYANTYASTKNPITGKYVGSSAGKNVLYQSVPGDFDGVPEDFYLEFESEITGIGKTDSFLVVAERNRLWRVDGFFGVDGSGGPTRKLISDTVGCRCGYAMASYDNKVIIPGGDQFYITDGYTVKPFSGHIKETYAAHGLANITSSDADAPYALVSTNSRRIFFFAGAVESKRLDKALVLDMNLSGAAGVFTELLIDQTAWYQWSPSPAMNVQGPPMAISTEALDGKIYFAGPYGEIAELKAGPYGDNAINANGVTWVGDSEPTRLISRAEVMTCAYDFGTAKNRKWLSSMALSVAPLPFYKSGGDLLASVINATDIRIDSSTFHNSFLQLFDGKYILMSGSKKAVKINLAAASEPNKYTQFIAVGGTAGLPTGKRGFAIYHTPPLVALDMACSRDYADDFRAMVQVNKADINDSKELYTVERFFPKNTIRSLHKSIRLTSAYKTVYKSDSYALATLTSGGGGAASTAVLASGSWPTDILPLSYWLTFEDDGYFTSHRILSRSGGTIQFDGSAGGFSAGAGKKWEIRGYTSDPWMLKNLTIPYEGIGESITPFADSELGENA